LSWLALDVHDLLNFFLGVRGLVESAFLNSWLAFSQLDSESSGGSFLAFNCLTVLVLSSGFEGFDDVDLMEVAEFDFADLNNKNEIRNTGVDCGEKDLVVGFQCFLDS